MIPGLAGVILVFVGTVITSLGVVRERQAGTLEQLAVMPLRPVDVFLGKIVPYFAVAVVDLVIVLAVGVAVFGVPFRGSAAVFGLGALLFVFVTLGLGVLISSVSQTQGQAIQLAVMTLLPQMLLSGLIFPLASIVAGVRWIAYLLPLTYFTEISRGVMLRAQPIGSLWPPFVYLALLGAAVSALATWRFRAFLAPSGGMRRKLGVIAAMLPEPELLILDEPTTGVDPVSRADLWWLIARAAAGGAAVLMSTTYLDEAARAAHVLVLNAGRALAAGTPDEIVASVPGTIAAVPRPPGDEEERRRAWRRAGTWRVWQPPGQPAGPGPAVTPDLQDAVCVAELRAELEAAGA